MHGARSDRTTKCLFHVLPTVFPDGQVPAAAGAGPAAMPRVRGGVEEDAPGQEAQTERQGGEREGKEARTQTHNRQEKRTETDRQGSSCLSPTSCYTELYFSPHFIPALSHNKTSFVGAHEDFWSHC